jgi:DNA modification methylase
MSTKAQAQRIIASERKFGQPVPFLVMPAVDGFYPLLDGHQRLAAWFTVYGADHEMDAMVSDRALTDEERREMVITLHTGATGSWNWDALSSWQPAELQAWGMDVDALKGWNNDANNLKELLNSENTDPVDAEPQIDRAAELQKVWQTESGQLWKLGDHRLLIGDCTVRENVERLMGGERAALLHADPPYGMGKENEGIANDNLYGEKLDGFQMQWWQACRPFLADNGSAYIWGQAEDLWRLWYRVLRDSERLTYRNEIVWAKGSAGAGGISQVGAAGMRQYPNETEKSIFFMLGEQGFNNNSDNYWHGWDGVKNYLKCEADKVGLTPIMVKEICGVGMYSHWFTESQWTFIPEEHYKKLQHAFKKDYDAFRKDYDELKKDFYSTRAYFDNTHDNMTDVWDFGRVTGEERMGHATPKPVEMMRRIIKSSAPNDAIVLVPFAGTNPELIAAQNLSRRCYAMEISPNYGAVILQRFQDATGIKPELIG